MAAPELKERLCVDHYLTDDGLWVFTERAHLGRGFCCGSGCTHCPFNPRGRKGNRHPREEVTKALARPSAD